METQQLFFFEEDDELEMSNDIYDADDDDDCYNASDVAYVRYAYV